MGYQQWRNQSEKIPKLLNLTDPALPLFSPEPKANRTTSSALPHTSFPRMGSLFSLAQWQELELQAQIYKYMVVGASVPLELILPLKRSLLGSTPCHHHQYFQPSMYQSGHWGRCIVDPEPGRCRRTDGKKWRCSRDAVAGQKYCERHVHRGRSRSRKPVEIPTTNGSGGYKAARTTSAAAAAAAPTLSASEETKELQFSPSGPTCTLGILPPHRRPPDGIATQGCLQQGTDSRVLMRFFDDWPSSEKQGVAINDNVSPISSSTYLSISIPENSDFSLKLSTGNANSWSLWENRREGASMGGPLAEALRLSTSSPSPTSVFWKPNGSVSEASNTST